MVAVAHDERERRAERPALAQPGEHLDLVLLDLLPRAAAVALLAAAKVRIDRVLLEDEAGGQAGEDRDERGAVRLARGDELKRHARSVRGCGQPDGRVSLWRYPMWEGFEGRSRLETSCTNGNEGGKGR